MKKILAVITCLLMILSLIACNNNSTISETDSSNGEDSKEDHVHSYTVENVTPELIAAEANCESAVSYFYSCSCGDVGDKTFTVDDTLGLHKTENGECIVCKLPESSAGLSYKLNSDGTSYTVTGLGTCTDSDIVIGSYNNMSVTGIYTGAFHSKQGITSVTICDTVTSIGSMAFSSTSIKSVSIGKGVRNIGYGAFALCTSLEEIVIPEGVTTISEATFNYCENLKKVTLPESLTVIERGAFKSCYLLTEITIPANVVEIGVVAFGECRALESIVMKNTEGWKYYNPDGYTTGTEISSEKLKDPQVTAAYLNDAYRNYDWKASRD